MLAIVTMAKNPRIPTTTNTITLWILATAVDPTTFNTVIAITTSTAKILAQTALSSANMELA